MNGETAIALTDLVLALICAGCAIATMRGPRRRIRSWATLLLVSVGVGALFGAGAHGLTGERAGPLFHWLWSCTLISIGCAALALYGLAAAILLRPVWEYRVAMLAIILLVPYAIVVVAIRAPFWLAVAAYLPALAAFLIALLVDTGRRRDGVHAAGVASVVMTVVAALVQRELIPSWPLNHNVAYHLIQMIAMLLIPLWTRMETRPHAQS